MKVFCCSVGIRTVGFPQVDEGEELLLPPRSHLHARCAYCTAIATSVEECLETLDAAVAAVQAVPAAPLLA